MALAAGCKDGEDLVDLKSERVAGDALRALPRLGSEDGDDSLHLVSELGAGDAGEDLRAATVYLRAVAVYVRAAAVYLPAATGYLHGADKAFRVEEDMHATGVNMAIVTGVTLSILASVTMRTVSGITVASITLGIMASITAHGVSASGEPQPPVHADGETAPGVPTMA